MNITDGVKDRKACSKYKVKSKSRHCGETTGPKWLSAECEQRSADNWWVMFISAVKIDCVLSRNERVEGGRRRGTTAVYPKVEGSPRVR